MCSEVNSQQLVDLLPEIRRAAESTAFRWPGVSEADDVEQDITVRLLESPGSLSKVWNMDEKGRRGSFLRMGNQIASELAIDYEAFSSQVYYSSDDVRRILEQGALDDEGLDNCEEMTKEEFVKLSKKSAEAWSALEAPAMRIDVEKIAEKVDLHHAFYALAKSNDKRTRVIWSRYVENSLDMSSGPVRGGLTRAVQSLTWHMNRSYKDSEGME